MYVYVDERGRITAYNPNNMAGNTGWEKVEEALTEPITEEHGVPLYKVQDGHAVKRSQEEITADIPAPEPAPVPEIEVLRAKVEEQQAQLDEQADALIELAGMIGG